MSNLDEAIKAGYTFCASRGYAELVLNLHTNLDPQKIIPDPEDIGGDGMPGFNCPNCESRTRVFDFMKAGNDADGYTYCDAALSSMEDLQVLQANGLHCNKTKVGDVLGFRSVGIPIYSGISEELISWLHRMKFEGRLDRHFNDAQPANQCPETVEGEEGSALNIWQLSGIWLITLSFAVGSLVTRCFKKQVLSRDIRYSNNYRSAKPGVLRRLERYDQWGNPADVDTENLDEYGADPATSISDGENENYKGKHRKASVHKISKWQEVGGGIMSDLEFQSCTSGYELVDSGSSSSLAS